MVQRRSSYIYLNGLRMHYLAWEPGLEGEPGLHDKPGLDDEPGLDGEPLEPALVLLHGLASNARIWDKVGPRLAARGYRVYALDQRGHGQSDKPENGYDFASLSRDLLAALDAWFLTHPVLVGHSWGASVVLDFTARYGVGPYAPKAAVLVDGGVVRLNNGPEDDWESVRERLKPPKLAGMNVDEFLSRVRRNQSLWQGDDEILQIVLANFEVLEDETIRPHLSLENHLKILRAMWEFDPYETLRKVRCSVKAILAQPANPDGDEFFRRKQLGATAAQQANPQLQVDWIRDSIHDLPLQRPDVLAGLIISTFASAANR
ncbi:MAG: alpha/beta fold hydrolase [Anaerolineales bacterium]|jgi:pimeloyl-ACP methyl ester carboxylesterase